MLNRRIQETMKMFTRAGIPAYVENPRTGLIVIVPRWSRRLRYHTATGRLEGYPRVYGIDKVIELAMLLR